MSTYNPYGAINAIYNLKGEWDTANKSGDSEKKKNAAQSATAYYNQLRQNGYSDVADTLSASNYTQAKYINDYYKALQEKSTEASIKEENENLFKNYSREYEDLKATNPFETEEGKSILAKYDLAGLQGRDNQTASNAGTNGGNIDSYAAANALRQQSALVNQGQQAVLSAYQQKLENARNLLSDMGVNIDRVYNQNETTKQNDFAIEREKAVVSGYTPTSWVEGSTNQFLNADGTLKSEYLTKEFDNTGGFSAIIAAAEKSGNTELLKQAKIARGKKILGNYSKYGKYDDGNYNVSGKNKTEEARQFDEQIAQADRALAIEEKMNSANNQNKLEQISLTNLTNEDSSKGNSTEVDYTAYNTLLKMWPVNETDKRGFIEEFIKPIYEGKETITEEGLKQLILTKSEEYNIDVDDAEKICRAFDVSTDWLNGYKDRTNADGNASTGRDGNHGGMVKK